MVRNAVYRRMIEIEKACDVANDRLEIVMSPDCYMHFCNASTEISEDFDYDMDDGFECSVRDNLDGIVFLIRRKPK